MCARVYFVCMCMFYKNKFITKGQRQQTSFIFMISNTDLGHVFDSNYIEPLLNALIEKMYSYKKTKSYLENLNAKREQKNKIYI